MFAQCAAFRKDPDRAKGNHGGIPERGGLLTRSRRADLHWAARKLARGGQAVCPRCEGRRGCKCDCPSNGGWHFVFCTGERVCAGTGEACRFENGAKYGGYAWVQ